MNSERQPNLFDNEECIEQGSPRALLDQLLADSNAYRSTDSYKALQSLDEFPTPRDFHWVSYSNHMPHTALFH